MAATALDLENNLGGAVSPPSPVLPEPETARESTDTMTRKWVAYLLLAVMTAIIIAAFSDLIYINSLGPTVASVEAAAQEASADAGRLMSLMNVIFGPVVTLFSSVVGFYFGARTAKESASG